LTFETIEKFRFYIGCKVRQDKIAAQNSRENGYREVALRHDNEAVYGEQLLKDLANEHGGLNA